MPFLDPDAWSRRRAYCLYVNELIWSRCWNGMGSVFHRQKVYYPRTLCIGAPGDASIYPPNAINNRKYNIVSFVPIVPYPTQVLYEQFKFFLNFYFLVMAVSQFIPEIRVGIIWTYWAPLLFVLFVTMAREAWDDLSRLYRDRELNNAEYEKLVVGGGRVKVRSADIQVGDMVVVHKDQRVPADMVLLRTSEREAASCFIRTDQLDGETDWKLRIPLPFTQQLDEDGGLFNLHAEVYAEKPQKDIHGFIGTAKLMESETSVTEVALNLENTLWAETVLASGSSVGLVIYTGSETRSSMNQSVPHSKVGQLDIEVNNLTKILFVVVMLMALLMVALKGFQGPWYRYFFRFVLLFSYIIPISLRVNLDMAKATYCWLVSRDAAIAGTLVRSSTIPEELGRVSYLLSDKTGTLTKNEMLFKKLHLGSVAFSSDTFDEVAHHLRTALTNTDTSSSRPPKHSLVHKTYHAVEALALCHNVTPIFEEAEEGGGGEGRDPADIEADQYQHESISYQAASPDEVALVKWSESVDMRLVHRTLSTMRLKLPSDEYRDYRILQLFPFTSESKRMGIILRDETTGEITFYMKGADTVMRTIVEYNDWLDEECTNMAREGLRTLVVAKKSLSDAQYSDFEKQYEIAKVAKTDRAGSMEAVVRRLEKDLSLLCLTGVEDALQDEVAPTLELLRNAGIRVWMLTGDKRETALCIAKSSGLFAKHEEVHVFPEVLNRLEAHTQLNALRRRTKVGLVITGSALKMCLQHYESDVAELVCTCTAVVCCRCSPEQKAQLVTVLRKYREPLRIAAVGDGGNDVAMIQAAHAGIGIVGKEGKQASLAADFSILQFSFLSRLMLVHGRYNYKRSSNLGQFVMHRGLIISAMQAVFSCVFYFVSVSLYPGLLMVAYSTFYTNFPVFSLVLDRDVKAETALMYPELYKDLCKGRSLSYKTFFLWFLVSIYQGAVIMYGVIILFPNNLLQMVSISFTSLILTELIMVALTIHSWHWAMVVSEIVSLLLYIVSLFVLPDYFDVSYMGSSEFIWRTAVITVVSCLPLYIVKCLRHRLAPPAYAKVN